MAKEATNLEATEKTLKILTALVEMDGAGITELSSRLGIPKSTVYVHLQTLLENEFVVQDGSGYSAALRFLEFGCKLRSGMEIYRKGQEVINRLAEETGELANLGIEENGKVVVVHLAEGDNAAHSHILGKRSYVHTSAMGKAILAHLSESHVEEIISRHGLPGFTEETITERSALFATLDEIRDRGYALDHEEGGTGVHCVAAPVFIQNDHPIGAVSITGPARRIMDDYEELLIEEVLDASNVLEVEIKYS